MFLNSSHPVRGTVRRKNVGDLSGTKLWPATIVTADGENALLHLMKESQVPLLGSVHEGYFETDRRDHHANAREQK